MDTLTLPLLLIGVVLLVFGADFLVRGASAIAERLGISPIVIGLTVVAFGTSAPELAVSVNASLSGNNDVAFGNVVGSNIFNILFILGISAAIGGLAITQRIVRLDVPILIGISILTYVLALNNSIGRLEGAVFFAGLVAYTTWLIRASRKESAAIAAEYKKGVEEIEGDVKFSPMMWQLGLIVVGLAMLIVGSNFLVGSASDLARSLGVSDLVIGLTVVAAGTSLPELATSVLAAIRGERDIAVGNVVGSNIFNLLGVLGLSAVVSNGGVRVSDVSLTLDIPVMIAATVVLIPIFWNGFRIKRWEGVLLAVFYVVYVVYLVLVNIEHDSSTMVGFASTFVAILVALGFSVAGYQGWRQHRAAQRLN
jgi:cation:H+ antiporter